MTINSSFVLRDIAGETILVSQGNSSADLTRIISLNSTAKELWCYFEGKEFELSDVSEYLIRTYNISDELAASDAQSWVGSLLKCGAIVG